MMLFRINERHKRVGEKANGRLPWGITRPHKTETRTQLMRTWIARPPEYSLQLPLLSVLLSVSDSLIAFGEASEEQPTGTQIELVQR